MADLATLSLAIDSRPAVEAANALDKMGEAAARGESKVGQIRTAADALIAALNRNTVATNAVTAALAQVEAAGGRAGRAINEVGASAATATASVVRLDRSLVETRNDLNSVATTARDATAAWAALGAMGAATAQRLDVARRMAAAVPGAAANRNAPLTGAQQANLGNLLQQGADVGVTAAMGMSPLMIAIQQGPQIAQSFAGPGALSLSQVFEKASEKASALAARVGVVGGAIGGLTATVIAGVAAQQSYSSTQTALAQQLSGVGRASGATAGQINALAPAAAAAGSVSVRSAREMAGEFAATGRIGSEMYVGLIGTAKDYAATTGQELPEATKVLAAAFADPGKGAETLNRQLGFLDAATRSNITTLAAQGDRLGAQRALFEAYKGSLTSATELTSAWGRVTSAVGTTISNAWDAVGRGIDRVVTGGDLETQIETARKALSNAQARQDYLPFGLGEHDVGTATAYLEKLLAEQQRRQAQTRQSDLAQRSTVVDDLVKQFNPAQERLKQIEQSATRIRTELAAGVLDPTGESKRTAEGLEASARRIREELAQGGSQFANAIREAQFGLRTVGFTPQGQRAASINERAENEILGLRTDPNDPLLRDFQINSIRERARIELETARRESALTENAVGGVFSRLAQEVQQQFLVAAQNPRYARIPVSVAAAITGPESGGNLDVGYSRALGEDGRRSSAYGLGQITAGTAADAARRGYLPSDYDRTNRSTMAEGILGVLSMKLDENGGDLTRAIMAYRGSADPAVNRAYAARVMRDAGQMGDASALGQVRDQDANNRALQQANDNLKNVTENYGRNAVALEANGRAQEQYRQLIDRGVPAVTAASIAFDGMQTKIASLGQTARFVQFDRDDTFAREQLGRSRAEQQAYAAARPYAGTAYEATVLSRTRDTAELYEARSMVTDGMTSFVTDLRRGGDAATALTNAFGNAADRLIAKVMDSAISSAFGAFGGTGGGGSLLGSLFGAGSGSSGGWGGLPMTGGEWFASGGVMTSHGRLPLNAYAGGGVANSPQVAVFGEGRLPEAYVPLPDGRRIPVAMQGAANGNAPAAASEPPVIINMTGQPVQTERSSGPRGPRDTIVIGKTIAGAIANDPDVQKALKAYGLRRTG